MVSSTLTNQNNQAATELMRVSPYFSSFLMSTKSAANTTTSTSPPPKAPSNSPVREINTTASGGLVDRDAWEEHRAAVLGLKNHRAVKFLIKGQPCELYSVNDMALIHGLPSSKLIEFGKLWTKAKSDFRHCRDFRVFCQNGMDYISRQLFDQCVAPLFESPFRNLFVIEQQSSTDTSAAAATEKPDADNSFPSLTSPVVADKWQICPSKRIEHAQLLSKMGNSRANYIAQIGPLDFKFGCTDKGILNRTTEHMKDFDQFNLIFAEHCSNTYRAESLFKADPLIKKRRKSLKTQRNNHTEIVTIDTTFTETNLKELYQFYISKVNAEEQLLLNRNRATNQTVEPAAVTPNNEDKGIEMTTPLVVVDPLQLEARRVDIEMMRVVQDHEYRMKRLEWEERQWYSAAQEARKDLQQQEQASSESDNRSKGTEDSVAIEIDDDPSEIESSQESEQDDLSSDLTEVDSSSVWSSSDGDDDDDDNSGDDDGNDNQHVDFDSSGLIELLAGEDDDEDEGNASELEEFFSRRPISPLPARKRQRRAATAVEVHPPPPRRRSFNHPSTRVNQNNRRRRSRR